MKKMTFRVMTIADYEKVYQLWLSCKGMGLNNLDDSEEGIAALDALKAEGIHKVAMLVFAKNETGNAFWESEGFTERTDITYRNKALVEIVRMDT